MKMRKKLAAVLAAAMIASVMPMTTFAASENRVSKVVSVGENTKLSTKDQPTLRVKLKDGMTSGESFFLTLDGANWGGEDEADDNQASIAKANFRLSPAKANDDGNTVDEADFDFSFDGDDLQVTYNPKTSKGKVGIDTVLEFTLDVFVEDGEATIEVDGHDSPVDSGKYVFAKTSDDYSVDLIVDDADDFANTGDVAEITIKEPFKGAFAGSSFYTKVDGVVKNPTDQYQFTLELRDSDFEFVLGNAKLKGKKGFAGVSTPAIALDGKDKVIVTLPAYADLANKSIGEFVIEDLQVKAKKNASKGEVRVTARNKEGKVLNGTQNIVVANYSDYTTTLKMKKDYEVVTGQEVEVEFTLAESIQNSLLNRRSVEFSLPKGVKFKDGSIEVRAKKSKNDNKLGSGWSPIDVDDSSNKYDSFEFDEFERVEDEDAEYEFKATLLVSNTFDKDEIILTAEGNALTDTHEVVAAKAIKSVDVDITPMDVKVGLRKQTGGKIVIKENVKEAILRNYSDENKTSITDAELEIRIDADDSDGLKITDADIKVTEGDLLLDLDAKVFTDGMMIIPVKRQSTKPSTVEITNIEVTANRSVPEGKFDIKVGGAALSKNTLLKEFVKDNALKDDRYDTDLVSKKYEDGKDNDGKAYMDPVAVKEFINITTKNTEDFTGVTAATVSFVLNSNQYLVNGVAKDMDATPYVKDGRTMVPVRYVATALGITEDKVVWDKATQTATILADKVIQVKLGSKTMVVNGANVPMTAAAELKADRTFVPVAEIARALGVSVEWNEGTKTATFNSVAK